MPSGISETRDIVSLRAAGEFMIIAFSGISTREAASTLRNAVIEITASDLPSLPPGEYYHHQIIGLSVLTVQGEELGRIAEIFSTGSNDVYIVRGKGREHLIPAIKDVINKIDLDTLTMTIQPMKGLLD